MMAKKFEEDIIDIVWTENQLTREYRWKAGEYRNKKRRLQSASSVVGGKYYLRE
jgi:hypothetical protein